MNIFLAVTAYNHAVFDKCSESVLKNCVNIMLQGHKVMPYYSNDLYIDRARNLCVDLFLSQSQCTDIVFVDADLEFDDDAILKLIKYDHDVVAGAYRYKKDEEDYSVTLRFDENNNCRDNETGLVFVNSAPAGLMRIKRSVFECLGHDAVADENGVKQYFKTGMICADANWYGEDSYFCKAWVDVGGKIYVDPTINFTHYGVKGYAGNYHNYLINRSLMVVEFDENETGLKGWMRDDEISVLKFLASKCRDVVEVGSWKGRSTKAFLESCKGTVFAVDHWLGSPNDVTAIAPFLPDVHAEFVKNVGHYENLVIRQGHSLAIAETFADNSIDMVFIDAGHTYAECKADIEAWFPKCKKIIAGHDYVRGHQGVIRAVNEKFSNINVVDSVWWKEI